MRPAPAPTTSRATSSARRTCGDTASPAICRSCSSMSKTRRAIPLVRQLLHAQEYWRAKDLRADVVILNDHPADYLDEVQSQLVSLVREPRWSGWLDKPGGMFLLRSDGMPEVDRHLLSAAARIVLRGDLGDLAPQLDRKAPWLSSAEMVPPSSRLRPPVPAPTAAPVAAGHGQRHRRLHAGRPRVRHRSRRRPRNAAALVQCPGECRSSERC